MSEGIVETIAEAIFQSQWIEGQPTNGFAHPIEMQYAKAAIAAMTEAGFAIVPVEATEAMFRASLDCEPPLFDFGADGYDPFMGHIYRAMIEAGRVRG